MSEEVLPSVRAFFSGLFDYAGLFPPTKLDMRPALKNYVEYLNGPRAWMLGRFIIPVGRLKEAEDLAGDLLKTPGLRFSVLGSGGKTLEEIEHGFESDLAAMASFAKKYKATVDSYEVRLPPLPSFPQLRIEDEDEIPSLSRFIRLSFPGECSPSFGPTPMIFHEVPWPWPESIVSMTEGAVIVGGEMEFPANYQTTGYKLRCGGVDAAAFPSCEVVAQCLCNAGSFPLKLTAGLHHPVRHFNESVGTKMHGFLNVVGAAMLRGMQGLGPKRLLPILEEEDPEAFKFDHAGFAWRDIRISTPHIQEARSLVLASIGSCSFTEPQEDLEAMGVLPRIVSR